jgi:hypothetical protein
VSGKVTYKGKPLPAGTITFAGADAKAVSAPLAEDGTYAATKIEPGTYKIAIDTRKAANAVAIPEKYSDPDKSSLTYQVQKGSQTHDIDLN